MIIWHLVANLTIFVLLGWWGFQLFDSGRSDDYPNRPIHIVVPYAAGGGSDTFVRIVQKGIVEESLLEQPLVIVNQPGGIGTIGSREVKNAEPDGYKILCHHNAIITAKLAETVNYGPEAFAPIALTGEMSMVILVRADSVIQNIGDLLDQAKATPRKIRFGANKGAPAYFTTLQLEKANPGAEFSIVSAGGGADRYSKLLGGHLEAGIFSLSEYLDFRGSEGTPLDQDIRAIAVLSNERHESIPDVPTTVEMGVPVILQNANYWWAPKGTPRSIIERLGAVLQQAMKNETVRKELARLRMTPSFDQGDSFQQTLTETIRRFEGVAEQKQAELPDFPKYVGIIVLGLLLWVGVETFMGKFVPEQSLLEEKPYTKRPDIALACLLCLCAYVFLLGRGWLPFAITTALMVMAIGGLMFRGQPARWPVLIQLAVLTGFGAQFIFTEIFTTTLP